jgi:YaiO family outer membrane protein
MRQTICTLLFLCSAAMAQDVDQAWRLATAGHRAEALAMLERRIAAAPNDLDAQVLYGTILSWERDFDHARRVLRWVLLRQPGNRDARLALENVELWSKQTVAAANEVRVGATYDDFENSDAWREAEVALKRNLRFGAAVGRAAHARRFGLNDDQIEIELYPRLGAKSYAYLDAGYSLRARLYPRSRFGLEVFQGFGPGLEASIGYRRLNFSNAANIYTGSFSKYIGDWLFTLRGYRAQPTNSLQFLARRYLGGASNYVGLRLGKGSTREEIRSRTDVEALDSIDAAVEARFAIGGPWSSQLRGGAGRQRVIGGHQRHTTASALLGRRF